MFGFLKRLLFPRERKPLQVGERIKVSSSQLNKDNFFWRGRVGDEGLVVVVHPNGDLMVQMDADPEGVTCDGIRPARFTRAP